MSTAPEKFCVSEKFEGKINDEREYSPAESGKSRPGKQKSS
jgi:hypothetical protein